MKKLFCAATLLAALFAPTISTTPPDILPPTILPYRTSKGTPYYYNEVTLQAHAQIARPELGIIYTIQGKPNHGTYHFCITTSQLNNNQTTTDAYQIPANLAFNRQQYAFNELLDFYSGKTTTCPADHPYVQQVESTTGLEIALASMNVDEEVMGD